MKTMMGCFATNSLCEKVKGDWHQLASSLYKLPVDPNPSKETKAMEAALLEKITATCHECQTAQLIKFAKAEVKKANKVLSEANKAFEATEEKTQEVIEAIYERLVNEKPELVELFALDDDLYYDSYSGLYNDLFDCALEHDAEWIAHNELVDDLREKVFEAERIVAKAKLMLKKLFSLSTEK